MGKCRFFWILFCRFLFQGEISLYTHTWILYFALHEDTLKYGDHKLEFCYSVAPQRSAWWHDWPFFRVWFVKQKNNWRMTWSGAWRDGVIGPFFRMWFVKHQNNWRDGVLKWCMALWRGRSHFREFRLSFKDAWKVKK